MHLLIDDLNNKILTLRFFVKYSKTYNMYAL